MDNLECIVNEACAFRDVAVLGLQLEALGLNLLRESLHQEKPERTHIDARELEV
jgi:hypothetical protein